jgi:hypothetical protein
MTLWAGIMVTGKRPLEAVEKKQPTVTVLTLETKKKEI